MNSKALNDAATQAFRINVLEINKILKENGYPYRVYYIKSDIVNGFDFEVDGVKMEFTVLARQTDREGAEEATYTFRCTCTPKDVLDVRFYDKD